jgi:hypothetical protein
VKTAVGNIGVLVIAVLAAAVVISTYQTLFCLWMVAHPVYASPEWETRLTIRFFTTLVFGGLLIFFLLRRRRPKASNR